MLVEKTDIDGLYVLSPKVYGDNRGWFTETYSKRKLQEEGLAADFVQDNHSFSAQKGTLRGLHFQINPMSQIKLIRCSRGAVRDIVVDLRKNSPTYKKWFSIELTEENQKQLWIPKGFAHGFLAIQENCEIQYKVDAYYSPEHDRSVRYDDPEIGIDWEVAEPILSKKDLDAPLLSESDANF
ncbi:MAG: dTDP-4-dehydrorhamnose 3,5-epimerase [Eubacteriales bacterium]